MNDDARAQESAPPPPPSREHPDPAVSALDRVQSRVDLPSEPRGTSWGWLVGLALVDASGKPLVGVMGVPNEQESPP